MIEELLFMGGCPHCGDGEPALVTIMFMEPIRCTYGTLEGLNREEFIAVHQSHRSATIMACKKVGADE